jgi:hypothetical protein
MSIAVATAPSPFRRISNVEKEINLSIYSEALAASTTYNYDYEIDSNLVLTGLEVTKTIAVLGRQTGDNAATAINQQSIVVTVFGVPAGNDAAVTLTVANELGRAVMSGIADTNIGGTSINFVVGRKSIAGTLSELTAAASSGAAIGTAAAQAALFVAETHLLASTTISAPVDMEHAASGVLSNATTAVGTTSKQRIRITVAGTLGTATTPATLSMSCFIKATFTGFNQFFNNSDETKLLTP